MQTQEAEVEVIEDGQVVVSKQLNMNVERLIEEFISSQQVNENSRATYKRELRQFFNWLEATDRMNKFRTWNLVHEDIVNYRDALKGELSTYTANGYLTATRKFFNWLERKVKEINRSSPDDKKIEYINPAEDIKSFKKPKGHRKDSLTDNQVREALESINRDSLKGLRDYAMFSVMVYTGLRCIEVSRAKKKDKTQKLGKPVLLVQGKGRTEEDEFVNLKPEVEKPIRKYLSRRKKVEEVNKESPLFASVSNRNRGGAMTSRSVSRVIKNILKDIGLDSKRISAHSLRHTAGTNALMNGASLYGTQNMLRHASPDTTEGYIHDINRVQDGAEFYVQF